MLQNIVTNPLMSHGLLWWCLYFLSGHGEYTVHTFPMEGLKTLGLNVKHLKLCSEDERRSDGLGHEGESLMTSFSFFWVNYPFKGILHFFGNRLVLTTPSELNIWVLMFLNLFSRFSDI